MAKRLNKKQIRETLKEPTIGQLQTIKSCEHVLIAGTNYAGKNPTYENIGGRMIKTSLGIPFVNMDKLNLS